MIKIFPHLIIPMRMRRYGQYGVSEWRVYQSKIENTFALAQFLFSYMVDLHFLDFLYLFLFSVRSEARHCALRAFVQIAGDGKGKDDGLSEKRRAAALPSISKRSGLDRNDLDERAWSCPRGMGQDSFYSLNCSGRYNRRFT